MQKRNTVQRSLVLSAVRNLRSHATAEEVYEEVTKAYPNVSRATVYRNLAKLEEEGEIRRLEIPGEPDRFDHICRKHYHLKCLRCGRIFDVEMESMNGLEEKITDKRGFFVTGHDVLFHGICPDCRRSTENTGGQPE